ncbi:MULTISPECIES: hypothetical protein [unclassified Streptomyces]|uniref:hypothetical protein n=1 Tax=unclassified Streptomyces TaxID=2593676 RepID=UPI000940041D|nr:hypothetical protein [Streptomyces sp. TSRI0281]OKI32124.1 hypothetical protein A6A29_21495 [Streptomyces sp. TSRI0281]
MTPAWQPSAAARWARCAWRTARAKRALFETYFLSPQVLPVVEHTLGDDAIAQDVRSFPGRTGGDA